MIISSEAKEAVASYFVHESYGTIILDSDRMRVDHLATAMQSLINSTLERAAGVADYYADMNAGSRDPFVNGCEVGAESVAASIRQLMETE